MSKRYGFGILLMLVGGALTASGCAAPRAVVGVTKGVVKGTAKGVGKVTKGTAKVVTKPLR
tara:strand:+ start:377 stop:559 length:183 start_codon:yes stop_codon:yes gene_type:complete